MIKNKTYMGWHLCNDYDSCFQAIWQSCMEVHMTAGESPVAKWRQYRISITLTWSLGYPGTQVLSWGSSSTFFLYAFFFKGHLYHISSVFILSDHILFVSGADVSVDDSLNVNLNKCLQLFKMKRSRWAAIHGGWSQRRSNVRWEEEESWHAEVKLV